MRHAMRTYWTRESFSAVSVYLLVALAAFIVFLPWAGGYFLGDDWMLYARNSGRALPEQLVLISDASNSSQFRPLTELTLAWLWSLFGLKPIGHHIVNCALHALNAVLVAALGKCLSRDHRVGLLAGLSFAVLGCHTEAVVWMTARHEMLVTAFALFSVFSYIKLRKGGRRVWWVGALLFYIGSFGFKENALMLPLLLGFYDLLFTLPGQSNSAQVGLRARQFLLLATIAAVGVAYLLYRLAVGGGYDVPFSLAALPKNLIYYLLMEAVALPDATYFLSRFPLATLPIISSLAVACAAVVWLARERILRQRVVWFGVLWMVVALAPVILIVAERTAYFSSIGWALAIAAALVLAIDAVSKSNLPLRRRLPIAMTVVILGANLVAAIHRGYWWDRAADISHQVFSQVHKALLDLPPGKDRQLWFVNLPNHIEYADAFGNRLLFAVWLLEDQWTVGDIEVTLLQDSGINETPAERTRRMISERAPEVPVAAIHWQSGKLVSLIMPETPGSP